MLLRVDLEEWRGSPVIRDANSRYERKPARLFTDAPSRLKPRQAVFYRNLIRIAEAIQSSAIPVDFELEGRGAVYLDRGCIKIAEHAGSTRFRTPRAGLSKSLL